MNVTILGAGGMGSAMAERLSDTGHQKAHLMTDEERLQRAVDARHARDDVAAVAAVD